MTESPYPPPRGQTGAWNTGSILAMKIVAIILGILFWAPPAQAFENMFSSHCKKAGVPKELAMAVARQESDMNPLCINIAGRNFTPKDHSEAVSLIRQAQAADTSYDVGLMQINSQWVKQWKIDPVCLLDPDTNIRLGVRILQDEISRNGLNWRAVGNYHSPNPMRARQYAFMVARRIRGNPELKSMLGNPRLGAGGFRSRHFRKLGDFAARSSIHAGSLGQACSLRSPVGMY